MKLKLKVKVNGVHHLQICAGLLLMIQSMIRIHKSDKERHVADVLNHIISAVVLLSVFCDIIKINFIQPDGLYAKAMD